MKIIDLMAGIGKTRIIPGSAALVSLAVVVLALSGCSTAPRRQQEVFVIRNTAANQLNLANRVFAQGQFDDALIILEDAWRLAVSADDPPLRINIAISRANVFFSLGRYAEAFSEWENAAGEGEISQLPLLAARARIYAARAELTLLSGDFPAGAAEADARAQELRGQLVREVALVRSEPLALAAGYLALGMAEKHLRRWAEAESAAMQSLRIYERARALEDAAYAWFIIASIRSLSGNYDAALQALRAAIDFDRRAENGFGLASSWHAMGDVYRNAGRAEQSRAAHRRAADIYRAIGLNSRAEELEHLTGD